MKEVVLLLTDGGRHLISLSLSLSLYIYISAYFLKAKALDF
jgi:hypothetical protein